MEIIKYNDKYAKQVSNLICRNMIEINSKDYGLEKMTNDIRNFTEMKIKKKLKNRLAYVVIDNKVIKGTGTITNDFSLDKTDFFVLSVFVLPEYHLRGIGRMIMEKLEEIAIENKAKKIIVPASLTAVNFYIKLGYKYIENNKEVNEEGKYVLEKLVGEKKQFFA